MDSDLCLSELKASAPRLDDLIEQAAIRAFFALLAGTRYNPAWFVGGSTRKSWRTLAFMDDGDRTSLILWIIVGIAVLAACGVVGVLLLVLGILLF